MTNFKRLVLLSIAILFAVVLVSTPFVSLVQDGSLTVANYQPASATATTDSNNTSHSIGGTVVVIPSPSTGFVDNFNPFEVGFYAPVIDLIYEPLFQINYETGNTTPWLATSYTLNHNASRLVVNIRHNVTFSNGMPLNSTDVAFSFNIMKKNPTIDLYGVWSYLSSVKTNGTYQVIFNFEKPDIALLYYILGDTYILPEPLWQNINSSELFSYADKNPIGTGPFTVTYFSPLKIILTRNPNYWQKGKPYIKTMIYEDYTTDSAALEAMVDGQATVANIVEPGLNGSFVAKNPEYNHFYLPPWDPYFVVPNDAMYPFNMSFIREAMSMAINRTEIYKKAEYGYEPPATAMINYFQTDFLNASTKSEIAKYTQYNDSAALALLKSHGYTLDSAGRLTAPNGTALPAYTMYTIGTLSDWVASGSIISSALAKIGIDVTVAPVSFPTLAGYVTSGNFQLAMYLVGYVGTSPLNILEMYDDFNKTTSSGLPDNTMFWNSSIDGWLGDYNSAISTSNTTTQYNLINKMYSILTVQMPVIPIAYNVMDDLWINSTIHGWPTSSDYYAIGAPNIQPDSEVMFINLYSSAIPVVTHPLPSYLVTLIVGLVIVVVAAVVASILYVRYKKNKRVG
jgi:peptide/nickel transport system substrate-binding protein